MNSVPALWGWRRERPGNGTSPGWIGSLPVDISRDGKTVLLDEQGEESGPNYTVAMRDMQGSPPIALGEGMAGDLSPDGKWALTNVSYTQLMLLPTGAGTAKRIDRGQIQQYLHGIHWMPDGKQIVFSGIAAGQAARCFIQNIDGGKPRPITPEGVSMCGVSPDGLSIAGGDLNGFKLYPFRWRPAAADPRLAAGRGVSLDRRPAICICLPGAQDGSGKNLSVEYCERATASVQRN